MPADRRDGLLFIARFLGALVVLYLFIAFNPVNDYVIVPFTRAIVHASAAVLRMVREPAVINGTVIRTPNFALDVRNGCNGVEAMLLLASAVFAFPATLRSRLVGLLAASAAIQLLNLVRVSSLVWLGEHHRRAFDLMHVAVWQTVVILAAVGMFLYWSGRFAR